ncbi:unnamed protein product [Blepharisma stoltei]|uniref:Uncharacterized protein n=1 Tax=Blepharisma stoltei TaxID=1481888 RepID=A0AAU9J585_9CILI|nr:unnamed protein product [Blepharisma stoltei]
MDFELISSRTAFALSISWFLMRVGVIIITPLMLQYSCDDNVMLFLQIVFYSTIISVFFQIIYFAFKFTIRHSKLTARCTNRATLVQILYIACDYLVYGLFRLIIFILGAVWLLQSDDCDSEVSIYTSVVILGYFGTCWVLCWAGCLSAFVAWWDAQTL